MCAFSSSSNTECSPSTGSSIWLPSPAWNTRGSPVKTCLTCSGFESTTQVPSWTMRSVKVSPKRAAHCDSIHWARLAQMAVWSATGILGPGGRAP